MFNNLFSKKNQDLKTANPEDSIDDWIGEKNENGNMAIDVYQTNKEIIIKSALAGVHPEDLKISLHNGLLTIRGFSQESEIIPEDDYLYKECYFGEFSRSLILPYEVDNQKIEASLEEGILTIKLPKLENSETKINIKG